MIGKLAIHNPLKALSTQARTIILQVMICMIIAWWTLYLYIDRHNELTELRIEIPALMKEVRSLQEENARLKYDIDQFESPIHLMELANKPEFSHLKSPYINEVMILPQGKIPLSKVKEGTG